MELDVLKREIDSIKQRNSRVEADKAWETSFVRRICICVLTYMVVVAYSLFSHGQSNVFLSSLVPVLGYLASTLSLTFIRKIWENGKHTDKTQTNGDV